MAMTCVSGCRERTGCMACEREAEILGTCACCKEPVYRGGARYEFEDGVLIHEDCLSDWARTWYKED